MTCNLGTFLNQETVQNQCDNAICINGNKVSKALQKVYNQTLHHAHLKGH